MVALTVTDLVLGRAYKATLAGLATAVAVVVVARRRAPAGPSGPERALRWLPALVPAAVSLTIDQQPRWIVRAIPDASRRGWLAFATFGVALASTIAIAAGVDVRQAVQRVARAVTAALRLVVSVALFVLLVAPLGVARTWRRSDPLGTGARSGRSAWHPVVPSPARLATRTYRNERTGPAATSRRPSLAGVARLVGTVVLLLAVDFGVGLAWEQVAPAGPAAPTSAVGVIPIGPNLPEIDLDAPDARPYPSDPREELASMRAYPWRHQYFQELQRAWNRYWPYVLWRPLPVRGRYLNISGWDRKSYRSPGSTGEGVPDVDFYGGSTTFGEGQRDEHTIPSEVVRLAERDGLPIRAHNHGVRGWVNWQEMLLFEQLTADPATKADLALFYDGANEIAAQDGAISGVPAHTALDLIDARLSRYDDPDPAAATAVARTTTSEHLRLLLRDYRETSALVRGGRWLTGLFTSDPAGASAAQDPPDHATVPAIYRRGQAMIQDIARRAGIPVLFFWQPLKGLGMEHYTDDIQAPTIDLSRLFLGHDDIFIDGTHHNEAGATIAAEAIWEHLRPEVEAWYDAR